jgi:hypothetical protein
MSHSARPRARYAIALGVASLVAALVPAPAQAAEPSGSVMLKQSFKFGGSNWVETIYASDTAGPDTVQVTLSKVRHKKNSNGKTVYKLREMQSWYFFGLNENTVEINPNNLSGSIDLGNQLPGVFEADINFAKIPGKVIKKTCNNNLSKLAVQKSSGSSMTLHTGNDLFGNLTKVPSKGTATYNNGKCNTSGHGSFCPKPNKGISGNGTTGGQSLMWQGSVANGATLGDIYVSHSKAIEDSNNKGSWSATVMGKIQKDRVNTNDKVLNVQGLPTLSGEGVVTGLGPESTGSWSNCSKEKRVRDVIRFGDQGGSLQFKASGSNPIAANGLDDDTDSGSWRRTEVGNRP